MTIAETIKAARERAGMTQEELAEQLEVSRQAVSKWEMGLSVPDPEHLRALSELFGVELTPPEETSQMPQRSAPWKAATFVLGALLLAAAAAICFLLARPAAQPEPAETPEPPAAVQPTPAPTDSLITEDDGPAITDVRFFDGDGNLLDPNDGANWYMFKPESRVLVAVSYKDSLQTPVYAVSLFLTPTGTETFNEREQVAVQATADLSYALLAWDIPESMMGHLEVRLECAGGATVVEELNVGTLE